MKMQTRKRTPMTRAFGIILSLAMAAAMFPGTAPLRAAADGDGTEITTEVTIREVSSWSELQSAVSTATNGTTINICANIDVLEQIVISNGKNVTIDLNGHTLDRGLTSAQSNGNIFVVNSGGNLTITNSASKKGTLTGGYNSDEGGAICNTGTLFVSNVTISGNNAQYGGGIENRKKAQATLTNCTIEKTPQVNTAAVLTIVMEQR